jgi:hypothetical protein
MHNRNELSMSKAGAKNFTVTLISSRILLQFFAVFPYISSISLGGNYEEMGSRAAQRPVLRVKESKKMVRTARGTAKTHKYYILEVYTVQVQMKYALCFTCSLKALLNRIQ